MRQTSVLLDEEKDSLYAVSAFSHLSSSHTARDLTRLVRVTYFPSCGWMTTRAFLTETLPRWPPAQMVSQVVKVMSCSSMGGLSGRFSLGKLGTQMAELYLSGGVW